MAYSLELFVAGTLDTVDVWVDSEKKWNDIRHLTYEQAKEMYPDLELQDKDKYNSCVESVSNKIAEKLRTITDNIERLDKEREMLLAEMEGNALALKSLDKQFLIRISDYISVDHFLENVNVRLNTPPEPKSLKKNIL
ncbi:hypothetical protein [Bacillus pumilus]|uniref:hypothetical protein n=1 Tax=Bacillus pumilus TaxID=1408 RepID=UPI002ABE23E2|nr:hypothetical protein [Bacillus pumilus]